MATLEEFAPAKINLTLRVLGRRADGYHELESLVAFARDVGDVVRLTPGAVSSFSTAGPTAAAIDGDNLAERVLRMVAEAAPTARLGALTLEKHLPVASGVGGGSADAGAALRLMRRANPELEIDWLGIARRLGADVPVCFQNEAAIMTGVGEIIDPVRLPGALPIVMVNPNARVPADKTRRVFTALAAPSFVATARPIIPRFDDLSAVVGYAEARSNDLAPAAMSVIPEIADVLAALRATSGCALARLSGAGPTCFGVFESKADAIAAAALLAQRAPRWWVRSAALS